MKKIKVTRAITTAFEVWPIGAIKEVPLDDEADYYVKHGYAEFVSEKVETPKVDPKK